MAEIRLRNVKKRYGTNEVIRDLSVTVPAGERLVLLGPSGCGKSTLLRMIAGLEQITEGEMHFGERQVNGVAPGEREVAMVFQNYALYPHMTVEQNITYGLRVAKMPPEEIDKRLRETLDFLGLEEYRSRRPHALSGGQRQRVALARAVIKRSNIFLLDEPLSNLDAQLRMAARKELLNIHEAFRQTMVYVTHDQIEAMTFGTKILVMNRGDIQMYGSPEDVYMRPANVFTARFIGSPQMNLIRDARWNGSALLFWKQSMPLHGVDTEILENTRTYILGIRPEQVLVSRRARADTAIPAEVLYVENQGASLVLHLSMDGHELEAVVEERSYVKGDRVYLGLPQEHLHLFHAETEENIFYPANREAWCHA